MLAHVRIYIYIYWLPRAGSTRPHVRSVLGKTFMDKMSFLSCKVTTQWYFLSKADVSQYQISLQSGRAQKKKKRVQ